uniref:Uncharacterized protein n=1 Tax=Rhizophora mucronata TaxID=61149 RepID=A0A2P2PGX2_RHIMU
MTLHGVTHLYLSFTFFKNEKENQYQKKGKDK